jgi:Pyruvate/2-oxoacid:ferredoxin oxidoreductase delta subunit
MTDQKDGYSQLSAWLGAPGSKRFVKVLEAMVTPDELVLILELKNPATPQELAARLKTDEKLLKAKLEAMSEKGIIVAMGPGYISHKNIVMFHHMSHAVIPEDKKPAIYSLWEDFYFNEWRDILVDEFERRLKTVGAKGHRVVPARKALDLSPKIKPDQILWYEDMEQMIERGESIIVTPCGCRVIWRKCDNPIDVCMHIDNRKLKESAGKRKDIKVLTKDEARALNAETEEKGLVHIPLNIMHAEGTICNCCEDCCMVVDPLKYRGRVHEILSPSRFRAVIDEQKCQGCQTCVERCIFDAIEMRKPVNSKKMKAYIINAHCMGCGVCVVKCPEQAMSLELIRPPEHIPEDFPEAIARRAQAK